MSNVNIYLRENLPSIAPKYVYVAPDIEEKRLDNAVKAFGYAGPASNVIALFDITLLGNGKDGLLFTGEQLIYRPAFTDPVAVRFADIATVHLVQVFREKRNVFETILEITTKPGSVVKIQSHQGLLLERLHAVLRATLSNFHDFQEERQLVPIVDTSETLKIAYLKAIINMASDAERPVEEKEFAEILMLVTRLNLGSEARLAVRGYMVMSDQRDSMESVIQAIDRESPPGQVRFIHISLTKDLINLYFSTGRSSLDEFTFLHRYRPLLQVTDGEIELAIAAIEHDHRMLRDDVSDDQIVSALKLLSAKAAAVGTPLAAVYLSGSVIGLSAAGLTSGLATLGMGGMLGLSGMTAGIGVAVLIGVGAYTGVRKLTGADEISRSKRRELMLNEVIKQTQGTLSNLIQDINYITIKLNELISRQGQQVAKISELARLLQQLAGAGDVLSRKSDAHQASSIKIRCATFLDEAKLKVLTREPTKLELHGFILGFYQAETLGEGTEGSAPEAARLVLKDGFTNGQLEDLSNAFTAIGYFNMSDVLIGNAADIAAKTKDKLTSLFS
jgi:hypothetical protein